MWAVITYGVVVTNLAHLLTALLIRKLVPLVNHGKDSERLAFATAALYILSPAGMFLVAPYSEAPFALITIAGLYLYALASTIRLKEQRPSVQSNVLVLASGACLAVSCTIRTNGLFNGALFAYDAIIWTYRLVRAVVPQMTLGEFDDGYQLPSIWTTILAGLTVAVGFIYPQFMAYTEFCKDSDMSEMPPWCTNTIPSITTSIQDRYWNVGFMRYWTVSNIPLFILAAPMLWILFTTGLLPFGQKSSTKLAKGNTQEINEAGLLRRFAVPQLLVALTTLTTAHVQIVNRLSSGYPLWYIILASKLFSSGKEQKTSQVWIRGMVMYAMIQGALFAAFLPPA